MATQVLLTLKKVKHKMKTKRIELNICRSIATALINADESGLSQENLRSIDNILKKYEYFYVLMPSQDITSFARCDVTKLWSDCLLCEVEVNI